MGTGCKCKAENRPLCVCTPPDPRPTPLTNTHTHPHTIVAEVSIPLESLNCGPLSASSAPPWSLIKQHATPRRSTLPLPRPPPTHKRFNLFSMISLFFPVLLQQKTIRSLKATVTNVTGQKWSLASSLVIQNEIYTNSHIFKKELTDFYHELLFGLFNISFLSLRTTRLWIFTHLYYKLFNLWMTFYS